MQDLLMLVFTPAESLEYVYNWLTFKSEFDGLKSQSTAARFILDVLKSSSKLSALRAMDDTKINSRIAQFLSRITEILENLTQTVKDSSNTKLKKVSNGKYIVSVKLNIIIELTHIMDMIIISLSDALTVKLFGKLFEELSSSENVRVQTMALQLLSKRLESMENIDVEESDNYFDSFDIVVEIYQKTPRDTDKLCLLLSQTALVALAMYAKRFAANHPTKFINLSSYLLESNTTAISIELLISQFVFLTVVLQQTGMRFVNVLPKAVQISLRYFTMTFQRMISFTVINNMIDQSQENSLLCFGLLSFWIAFAETLPQFIGTYMEELLKLLIHSPILSEHKAVKSWSRGSQRVHHLVKVISKAVSPRNLYPALLKLEEEVYTCPSVMEVYTTILKRSITCIQKADFDFFEHELLSLFTKLMNFRNVIKELSDMVNRDFTVECYLCRMLT